MNLLISAITLAAGRALQGDDYDNESNNMQNNNDNISTTSTSTTSDFDPRIFWGVNIFIFFLLIIACTLCWKFNTSFFLQVGAGRPGQMESDIIYQRSILERRRQKEEQSKQTPEQRKALLMDSFIKQKVIMNVSKDDILDEITERPPKEESVVITETTNEMHTIEEENSPPTPTTVESLPGGDDGTKIYHPPSTQPLEQHLVVTENDDGEDNNNNIIINKNQDEIDIEAQQQQVLPDGDFHDDDDDDSSSSFDKEALYQVDECENGYLTLPCNNDRQVPNCCAICLCPYEAGDEVVWSSNYHCKHAFHLDCIIDWFIKMQDGTPCPCCRQEFIIDNDENLKLKKKKQKRITWAPTSFDTNVIQFR